MDSLCLAHGWSQLKMTLGDYELCDGFYVVGTGEINFYLVFNGYTLLEAII